MNITIEQLEKLDACGGGLEWFKEQENKDARHILKKLITTNPSWANWFLTRVFTKKQSVQYAVYSAETCLAEFEKRFPEDKRPRRAIEAAKAWSDNPSIEPETDVYAIGTSADATWSAVAAATSAKSAHDAARSAAWSAAAAATSADCDASWMAEISAKAAAWSATEAAWKKIINKGIEILGL